MFSPPFKKIKLENLFIKLQQFELFKILSFLTNKRNSIVNMLCLNKTIFNELFNENNLQKNINQFILRNENKFVKILLSIIFNYKLNLFVNNEIYNTLNKTLHFKNNENIFTILQTYLNNPFISTNGEFYCNDGKNYFSNDTMIYREEDDICLQFEFNLQKNNVDSKKICYSSLQNENHLLFSNLKNILHRLRNCFDFLTGHIQSLQSFFNKRIEWSVWLNKINIDKYRQLNNKKLKNIKQELRCKIFDKVNFVKVKKNEMLNCYIYITKYKIGENLEFNYNAAGCHLPCSWSLDFKIYNNNNTQSIDNNILKLIESNTEIITINLQNLIKIKNILQIDDNLVSNELLMEAILISCPQWNLLKVIKEDFNIKNISFNDNDVFEIVFNDINNDVNNEINIEINKMTEKKSTNKFTILNLFVELLNCICDYLFYLKDGLSFCLSSKDIYNAIYWNNNLFMPNKIIKDNFIPLIMTKVYSNYNDRDLNKYNNYFFKLFEINLERIEHFIGYLDSLQRYIYVKQNEFNNFLSQIKNKDILLELKEKIFKKLIYQSSRIDALQDEWCYKAFYNINKSIYLEQEVRFNNFSGPEMYWDIKIIKEELEFTEISELQKLLEKIDEKQLRKYLDLEDERVSIDLIFKCLKCCSPFKFEFIEYCEENNSYN